MSNRNDVAREAGVSGATVSRVYNDPGSVLADTREKVLKASAKLGYTPNIIARNFVRGKSGNIGVVMPYIPGVHIFSAYYFSEILSGIGEALREKRYDLMLFLHRMEERSSERYQDFFAGGRVDGCILLGTKRHDRRLLELKEKGRHFCLINNYLEDRSISFIDVDNVSGSYDIVKYLISLGCSRIAFLNGPDEYMNSRDRRKGYMAAMEEAGLPAGKELLFEGNYGYKSGYQAADRICDTKELPDAVFAANDRMAAGLMEGLKKKGIRIPEDISVAGYDDSDIASISEPPLTTVRVPFYEMGLECARMFVDLVESKGRKAFGSFIRPEAVIRRSTKKFDG